MSTPGVALQVGYQPHNGVPAPQWGTSPSLVLAACERRRGSICTRKPTRRVIPSKSLYHLPGTPRAGWCDSASKLICVVEGTSCKISVSPGEYLRGETG